MKTFLKTILILTILLALAACQQAATTPAATITSVPGVTQPGLTENPAATGDPAGYPPPTQAVTGADYPGPNTTGAQPAGGDYPPPAGVPAAENRSIVKATLMERGADPQVPDHERLYVSILESAAAEGLPSQTDALIGEMIFLFVLPSDLPELEIGDTFTAEVTFRGDEFGGAFYATKIAKQ